MSHITNYSTNNNTGALIPVQMVIQNYTLGGESVSLNDVPGVTAVAGVIMGSIPSTQNSLGVPLFPILDAGKIRLFQFTAGSPVEIPTTTALNATITAIVLTK